MCDSCRLAWEVDCPVPGCRAKIGGGCWRVAETGGREVEWLARQYAEQRYALHRHPTQDGWGRHVERLSKRLAMTALEMAVLRAIRRDRSVTDE